MPSPCWTHSLLLVQDSRRRVQSKAGQAESRELQTANRAAFPQGEQSAAGSRPKCLQYHIVCFATSSQSSPDMGSCVSALGSAQDVLVLFFFPSSCSHNCCKQGLRP